MLNPSPNKYYNQDINYIMLYTRNALRALGIWPGFDKDKSILNKIIKYMLVTISCLIMISVFLPSFFFWIIVKNPRVRIQMMIILVYNLLSLFKYMCLLLHQGNIRYCLKHIEEDWKNVGTNERNVMLVFAKTSRRMVIIIVTFLYCSGFSFRVLIPLSKKKMVNAYNVTIRPLPSPIYLFSVDTQASPNYELLYAIQCMGGLVTLSLGASACGLLTIFVMHAYGQMDILISLMNDLVAEQRLELETQKKLAVLIEHQTRIRR